VSGASAGALAAAAGLGHASISAVAAIPAVLFSVLFVIMELWFVPLYPLLLLLQLTCQSVKMRR